MSKEDSIEVTGTVLEKFPSGLFSVQLEHQRVVLAHLAGRLRRNRIRVLAGDKVTWNSPPTISPKAELRSVTDSLPPTLVPPIP
jgi:translation initiation factor IF-1